MNNEILLKSKGSVVDVRSIIEQIKNNINIDIRLVNDITDKTLVQSNYLENLKKEKAKRMLICNDAAIETGIMTYINFVNNNFSSEYESLLKLESNNMTELKKELKFGLAMHYADRQTFLSELNLISDELVTNAFFNAPYENGDYLFRKIPRSENVILENNNATVELLRNKELSAIKCTDNYGRLDYKTIISNLKENPKLQSDTKSMGAQIGISLVYFYSDVLIFDILKNKYTNILSIKYNHPKDFKIVFIDEKE